MGKSRKTSKRSIMKSLKKTASRTLPVVNKGLQTVGTAAKSSIPVIEKGVSAVYDTMATGLDVGVKGVKRIKRITPFHSRSRSRSRSLAGGRRTRRHRRH
jgi:hypothetical protein